MHAYPARRERGAALIFALVMLLLLTLLGITAITTSSLQEKMAGNMRDQYMAQQAGDSILLDGQAWIFNMATKPTPVCPPAADRIWDSSCLPAAAGASAANWWMTAADAWWTANGFGSSGSVPSGSIGVVAQDPRYVVEMIQKVSPDAEIGKKRVDTLYFRTTGWAVGASNLARSLFQGVFSRKTDTYQN